MNPPLPSDAPRTPSEEGRADSDGSPIMHWERVESSACKLSRSDDRVRSFVKGEEGKEVAQSGEIIAHEQTLNQLNAGVVLFSPSTSNLLKRSAL